MKEVMTREKTAEGKKKPTCGIIMPISATDSCSSEHWIDVLGIIKEVCTSSGFVPNMVNDAEDIGVIHKRIVENIYSSDIIICDVSCKNANVMFELGMRLAFDKPTIIIKDEMTGYSFDTSLIEHVEYPRDLRFTTINKFRENLAKRLIATFEKSKEPNFSTFLKNFGKYKIAHLEEKEVSSDTFLINAIEELKKEVRMMRNLSVHEKDRQLRRNFVGDATSEEKRTFKKHVQDYLLAHNLKSPKDIYTSLDDMTAELEAIGELRDIAVNPENFRKLVKEATGMI